MKAIIKKRKKKKKYITIKIIPEKDTEQRFLDYLLQNEEEFIIKTSDSIDFVVYLVKCDTCDFNLFQEEIDGTRNGKEVKIKLGSCNCPDRDLIKKMVFHPLENNFRDCIEYKRK